MAARADMGRSAWRVQSASMAAGAAGWAGGRGMEGTEVPMGPEGSVGGESLPQRASARILASGCRQQLRAGQGAPAARRMRCFAWLGLRLQKEEGCNEAGAVRWLAKRTSGGAHTRHTRTVQVAAQRGLGSASAGEKWLRGGPLCREKTVAAPRIPLTQNPFAATLTTHPCAFQSPKLARFTHMKCKTILLSRESDLYLKSNVTARVWQRSHLVTSFL